MAETKTGAETTQTVAERMVGAESFADFNAARNEGKKAKEDSAVSVPPPEKRNGIGRQARSEIAPTKAEDADAGEETDKKGQEAGETGTKADTGDGKSEQQTRKDETEDGDGKSEKPGDRQTVEAHIKRRLGREQRKHDRAIAAKDAEIERLKGELESKGQQEPPDGEGAKKDAQPGEGEGEGEKKPDAEAGTKDADTEVGEEPQAEDFDTFELYLDAWAEWDEKSSAAETAGQKKDESDTTKDTKTETEPEDGTKAGDTTAAETKPEEGKRDPIVQSALDDILEIVEADDDIGEKFAEGVEKGDIALSDAAVGYLDSLDDEQVMEIARKLVEDPRLSRRIARSATPRSQLAKLKKLHSDNAGTEGSGSTEERREPLRPTRGQAKTKSLAELAQTGTYAEFKAARNEQRREQTGIRRA